MKLDNKKRSKRDIAGDTTICIVKTTVRYHFKCGKKEKNTIFIRLESNKKKAHTI